MTPNAMAFKPATETPAADARFKQDRLFVMFNKASVQKAMGGRPLEGASCLWFSC